MLTSPLLLAVFQFATCAQFDAQGGYLGLALMSSSASAGAGGGETNADTATTPIVAAAEIDLLQGGTSLVSGAGSHAFGNVTNDGNGGTTSGAITFTIQNTGTADLAIASVSISAGDVTQFDIDTSGLSSPIAGSGSASFTLTFDPTATGAASATVTVANDDADESAYTFTITGNGIAAATKRVFVTAATSQGNVGDTTAADNFCLNDTNNPAGAGSGTWKAALVYSDGSRTACASANCAGGAGENVDWVFAGSTTYTRSDGATAVFTTTPAGVFDFATALTNSIGTTGERYWTGLNTDWTTTNDCTSWTVNSGGNQGERGLDTGTDSTAISGGGASPQCNQSRALLCVEQ